MFLLQTGDGRAVQADSRSVHHLPSQPAMGHETERCFSTCGEFKLHDGIMAAEAGKPWSFQGRAILQLLFQANPDALNSSLYKGLSPALLAASATTKAHRVNGDDNGSKDDPSDVIANNDPFGLLTAKHHQRIQRLQMTLSRSSTSSGSVNERVAVSDDEQLETIFELLRADPTAVAASRKIK